jgi:hypothetical protein
VRYETVKVLYLIRTRKLFTTENTNDCKDAGGRQKTAPAFSAFTTSLWLSNAGAVAEDTKK